MKIECKTEICEYLKSTGSGLVKSGAIERAVVKAYKDGWHLRGMTQHSPGQYLLVFVRQVTR